MQGLGALLADAQGFVCRIARRVCIERRIAYGREDLVGYGVIGLLEAQRRFDPERGVAFSTFAYHRVRGAILDGIRDTGPLPRRIYRQRRSAEEAVAASGAAKTSAAFVCDVLGYETIDAPGGRRAAERHAMIGDALEDETEAEPIDRIVKPEERSPEGESELGELAARIPEALSALCDRERVIVRAIYFEDRLLEDIGAELGLSRSWVCRIHHSALARLRPLVEAPARGVPQSGTR